MKPNPMIMALVKANKPGGEEPTSGDDEGLMAAAEDLLSAIASKDAGSVASALKNAFKICDALPHEEGPHEGETEE